MVGNDEQVARALFSPRMIYEGELQTEAFMLRAAIGESYLSVLRMGIASWQEDIMGIPQRKNRRLYGYAQMGVGAIRGLSFSGITYDVRACDNVLLTSHAGIFIDVAGQQLVGGVRIKGIADDAAQDFLILAIQRRLVELARQGLHRLA